MRTKAEILEERLLEAKKKADELESTLNGMRETECGLTCSGCGTLLETEYDFAAHFVIPDERYLNLGNCPNTDYERRIRW